jgi:hypothetical protein
MRNTEAILLDQKPTNKYIDEDWYPITNASFPIIQGHSVVSGAAAEVLTNILVIILL